MKKNEIEKIKKILEKVQALSALKFNLDYDVPDFPDKTSLKLPSSAINTLIDFRLIEFFWFLNLENAKINALNLDTDVTMGSIKINAGLIIERLSTGFDDDPKNIFAEVLQKINYNFLVIDNLYPNHLIGYRIEDGNIEDNLWMITAGDHNLYDLSLNIHEYLRYGYSSGFFYGWQTLFIASEAYDEKTKKLGYYVPQILPKEIHEPFMQKFKERFGEIEYKPEDYR